MLRGHSHHAFMECHARVWIWNPPVNGNPPIQGVTRFTRQGLQSKHATAGLQFMQKIIEFVVVLVIRTRPYNSTGFALCQQCGCTILWLNPTATP